MLRINRASPPIHTGLSGKGALLAALTWPLSRPPALAHQHHLPFRRYAEATPGVGSLTSPPGASTHAFRATRPAAPQPRTPPPLGPAVSSASTRPNGALRSRGGPKRARGACPAPRPLQLPDPAAGGGSPGPRAALTPELGDAFRVYGSGGPRGSSAVPSAWAPAV